MRRVLLSLLVFGACTKAGSESSSDSPVATAQTAVRVDSVPAVAPGPPAPITPPKAPPKTPPKTAPTPSARVELTAVTLADDCGGAPPWAAPTTRAQSQTREKSDRADRSDDMPRARGSRRCEQTSMQLAVIATDAMNIRIKSVKLYDDAGTLVATLTATKPTKWSPTKASYERWNEAAPANTTINVSYVLSQPNWGRVADRWNKTFTLKAVVAVGGVEQTTQKDVTLSAATSLPPNVRT